MTSVQSVFTRTQHSVCLERAATKDRSAQPVQWSRQMEDELRQVVESKGLAVAKRLFSKALGVSAKTIERKANRLFPERAKRKTNTTTERWTEEEAEEILPDLLAGVATPLFVSQRLSNLAGTRRSVSAVRAKMARSGRALEFPGKKAADVAVLIGCSLRQVKRYVAKGYLATSAGRITRASIEHFCQHRSHLIPYASMSPEQKRGLRAYGFTENAAPERRDSKRGAKALAERLMKRNIAEVDNKQAAQLLSVSVRRVERWIAKGRLPRQKGEPIHRRDLVRFVRQQPGVELCAEVVAWLSQETECDGA